MAISTKPRASSPRRRISNERPVLSDDVSFGERALLRRRQDVTVKLCALRLYALFLYECLQMAAQFRAGMRRHTAANAHREMIAARERPDITFKVRQELDGDGVFGLRHEVTLRHFQLVALRSEEHTSELQSHLNLVCRLLLEKKKP